MSGIAGIINLDGRAVDRVRLQRMADAMAHRGPDALTCWTDGPAGLAHAMLHATAESLRERQPLAHAQASLCITLDGRVDNRQELQAALRAKGYLPRSDADAELVLQAYACWGEDCARRILGDFAFALWDGNARRLFCARDALGIRPFYYHAGKNVVLFGSELAQLFEGADIACEPNEGMIGEYLANAINSREETLYRGILRLQPAHSLSIRDGRVQVRRYWDADPAHAIRHRSDGEYAEHFMEIFAEAVRCRMRSHAAIGAELSGGLDSSSVASLVRSLQDTETAEPARFETYSLVFPGLACDESSYIGDVVRKTGVLANYLPAYEPDASCHREYVNRHRDFPGYPGNYMWDSIRRCAREKNARVHLTGLGGDDWLSGGKSGYAELLHSFRLRELLRRARVDAQLPEHSGIVTALLTGLRQDYLSMLAPGPLNAMRWLLRREGVPNWIEPQFARRIHLRERLQRRPDAHEFSSIEQRDQYRWLNGGYLPHSFEYDDRSAAQAQLDLRHPFHDRRLVEFAFALPREQLWRNGQHKFILRQAMRDLLPDSVCQRQDKAEFSHAWAEAFLAQGGSTLFDALAICRNDWVNLEQVRTNYLRMLQLYARGDQTYSDHTHQPWMVFGIDLWYRIVFDKHI